MEGDKDIQPYRSDVIFNSEEDVHDPNLLVGWTLDFAMRMNTPADNARLTHENGDVMSPAEYQNKTKKELLKVFGLEHTHDTKVGDQYTRGVSGRSFVILYRITTDQYRRREEASFDRRSLDIKSLYPALG